MVKPDFFAYSRQTIERATAEGRFDMAHNRVAALRCLELYLGQDYLPFDHLTTDFVAQFKAWMIANGRKESTARLYINQVNALYNAATKDGIAPKRRLLQGIKSAMPTKQVRQILTEDELHRLRYADLTDSRPLSFARDLFLFSIYGRGISFTDMAYIKKTDVCGNRLIYTSQVISPSTITVPWDSAMQAIVNRYPSTTLYLLPIIKSTDEETAHRNIRQVRENITRAFKLLTPRLSLSVVPSMYMVKDLSQRVIDGVSVSGGI